MKTFKLLTRLFGLFLIASFMLIPLRGTAQDAVVIHLKGLNNMTYDRPNITVKPGQKVTIKLTNTTQFEPWQMSHNFVLLKQTVDIKKFIQACIKYAHNDYIAPGYEDQIIAHTAMAAGGETVEVTFIAPKRPSKYMFVCTFPGHFLAGMKGTLTVEE